MIPETAISKLTIGCCLCCSHCPHCGIIGHVISGSTNIYNEMLPVARIGDIVIASCGMTGTIVTGVPNVLMNNIPVATIGSQFVGCYTGTIITGTYTVVAP